MIIFEKIRDIAVMLRDAAISEETVSYSAFHAIFDSSVSVQDKYFTLDAASRALSCVPIYSALMAKKDGYPGAKFYEDFKNIRPDEFRKMANDDRVGKLTSVVRRKMADLERSRVYKNARNRYWGAH